MQWLRKRAIPCLLLFSLIFSALSFPASAVTRTWNSSYEALYQKYFAKNSWSAPDGSVLNNDTGVVGPLKFSNVPKGSLDEVFSFMHEFEQDYERGNTHYYVNTRDGDLKIWRFPDSISSSDFYVNQQNGHTTLDRCYVRVNETLEYSYLAFDLMTGECTSSQVLIAEDLPRGTVVSHHIVSTCLITLGFDRRDMWTTSGNSQWKPFWYNEPVSFEIDYSRATPLTHTLSIDYQYADGTEAAESYAALLEEGSAYDVPSPQVPGYTPDLSAVTGEMGSGDIAVTVTYTKDPVPVDSRTLTIYYLLSDGSQAADPYSAVVAVGTDYSVPSPVVSGYQTDRYTVSGTMGESDEIITVIYTPLAEIYKHTLAIRYQTGDGREAAPAYSSLLAEGEPYSVASPAVTGYRPDRDTVSGSMGTEDVQVTVIYTSSGTDPAAPGVEVAYQFEDGSAAAPACRKELSYGQFYWIASPSVPGYTPDRRILFGTVPRDGVSRTVTYRANSSGSGSGIPWLPSGGGGIQWEPPSVSGLPYQPSDAGGLPWKP